MDQHSGCSQYWFLASLLRLSTANFLDHQDPSQRLAHTDLEQCAVPLCIISYRTNQLSHAVGRCMKLHMFMLKIDNRSQLNIMLHTGGLRPMETRQRHAGAAVFSCRD